MTKLLTQVASLFVLGTLIAVMAKPVSGADYQTPGRLFGGVDVGIMQPVDGFASYVSTGGVLAPFVGYKLFQDRDMQLNFAALGQAFFIGGPNDPCPDCLGGHKNEDSYALGGTIGPRVSLPVGPVELYGTWGIGFIEGLTTPSALEEGSWGQTMGGGINYSLNENVMIGAFARWNIWYQHSPANYCTGEAGCTPTLPPGSQVPSSLVGYVKYVTTGLSVTLQQSPPPPPPPPAPVAAAPPPPPPPPAKKKIVLRGVNFDFDKYNIRPDAVPILEQACSILKQEATIDVSCQGYTDSVGTDAYNQKLSERRANSVRDWLVKCGIAPTRLSAKGFGETNPVASNETPEGRAQNRRTELVVVNP